MWNKTLAELDRSTGRLLATVTKMTDTDVRAPSSLPGWTQGQLLTHIARNADSLHNLLVWARTGVVTPQYESLEQRNGDLDAGAGRSAAEQLADIRESAERFAAEAGSAPGEARTATVRAFVGYEHPGWYTLLRRWREVEAHHADLAAGYSWEDWPETYVRWDLADTATALSDLPISAIETGGRVWTVGSGPTVSGTPHQVLAWLAGRTTGDGLSVTPAGPLPSLPPWPVRPHGGWPADVPATLPD